jgi:dihydroneopterin aldolase
VRSIFACFDLSASAQALRVRTRASGIGQVLRNAYMLYRFCYTMLVRRRIYSYISGIPATELLMELFDAIRSPRASSGAPQPAQADANVRRPGVDEALGGASDTPMDIVYIEGFTGQTVIGIDVSELRDPQTVRISLAIGVPSIRACVTDCIEDTVNYAAVHDALHVLLASHGVQLLERLAEMVAQLLIGEFGAHWVRVSLAKPAKFDDVESVGVVIERRRRDVRVQHVTCEFLGEGFIPMGGRSHSVRG